MAIKTVQKKLSPTIWVGIVYAFLFVGINNSLLAQAFGGASDFNLFVRNNAGLNYSDVEGRVAIGGTATIQDGYSIGMALSENAARYDLIVGGSFSTQWNMIMERGSIIHSGTYTQNQNAIRFIAPSAGRTQAASPINFSTIYTDLQAKTSAWGTLAATGTFTNSAGVLTFTGANVGLNVFNLGALPNNISTVRFNVPANASILVNVTGVSPAINSTNANTFSTQYWDGSAYVSLPDAYSSRSTRQFSSKVIWNFYQATTLTLQNVGFKGSIMAPNADLSAGSGHIDGQLMAKSMQQVGGGNSDFQVNYFLYDGLVPTGCGTIVTAASNAPLCTGATLNLSATPSISNTTSSYQYVNYGNFIQWWGGGWQTQYASGRDVKLLASDALAGRPACNSRNSNDPALWVDGQNNASQEVWYLDVGVVAGRTYNLSFYALDLYGGASAASPRWFVGGVAQGTASNLSTGGCNNWVLNTVSWTASSTATVRFSIRNGQTSTASNANDFGIDNVSILWTPTSSNVFSWSGPNSFSSSIQNPSISNFSAAGVGTYSVTLTNGGCVGTATTAVALSSACATIGNYVWTDTNGDGINNEAASAGINGISVALWNAGANAAIGGGDDILVGTTLTANNGANPGYYNFNITTSGNYFVQFPVSTANGKVLTTATTTAATDNNSDANVLSGFSPVFAINTAGSGTAKDNPTIDAGYKIFTTISGPSVQTCAATSNGMIAAPVYSNGNPLAGGTAANKDAFYWFLETNIGEGIATRDTLPASQLGSVWGVAYKTQSNQLFTSAFLKRHVGFGSGGPGAIYKIDLNLTNPTATLYADLAAMGVSVGANPRVATSGIVDNANELPADAANPSWDVSAFSLVGKMALGGLDISTDGTKMFVMSLNSKELVELNVSGATPTYTNKYLVPNPGCSNGDYIPWAVKCATNGKVYIGVVCTGETSQLISDLTATIMEFDGTTSTFKVVYSFPLNYDRGYVGGANGFLTNPAEWRPWTSTYRNVNEEAPINRNDGIIIYPQAILSDIEIDTDGSFMLALMDRNGHQTGNANYKPVFNNTSLYGGQTAGDILKVGIVSGAYQLENNASVSGSVPTSTRCFGSNRNGAGNNQGPGGGEAYWSDSYLYNPCNGNTTNTHDEIGMGALAFRPGSGELIASAMNPTQSANSGGIIWLSNTTGDRNHIPAGQEFNGVYSGYRVYNSTNIQTFGKAAGMGDIEFACVPNPQGSVGNYVWTDTNGDGIQNEPVANGLNGVMVQLWSPGADAAIGGGDDALVGTTTTANNGSGNPGYYNFNITVSGNYYLKFPTTNGTNVLSKNGWQTNDDTDMNAEAVNGNSTIFNININGIGFAKDNPTYDAGYAPCLAMSNVTVGACQNVGGESKAIVSATIAAPSAHLYGQSMIVVTAGGITQYHASDQTPLTVNFLLPADGSTGNISVYLRSQAPCSTTVSLPYTLPAACTTNPCGAAGTIGGTVYNDANGNGVRDQGEYGVGTGVSGVTVTLFSNTGQVAQTTTNTYGQYTFTGLTTGQSYRVELSNFPTGMKPAHVGTSAGSSVQFITVPGCANLGLAYPEDYCQDNPYVLAPTFANGNPTASTAVGSTGNLGFLHRWLFNTADSAVLSGANFGASNFKTTTADSVFRGYQIGAVWGLAYNKSKKQLFASSVLRRHVGYGPLGSGGIYKMDFSTATPSISNWLNFDALGIATGASVINNANRSLPSTPGSPNNDFAAYDGVGKYSFGDLEISDDGNKLFVVNLYDRKLYIIDISGGGTPTLANISSVAMPASACTATNGNFRPWALKFYHGKIYLGGLCSGETQAFQPGFPDLTGTIYSLDPANIAGGFTQVFTFPFNYRYWSNWYTTYSTPYDSSPMITDIEFDIDGSMILGILDRKGLQLGNWNYLPTGTTFIDGTSSGDILRVHNNNGTYSMEANGVSGPLVGTGAQTLAEPPSWSRGFFQQQTPIQRYIGGQLPIHPTAAQGALAILPSQGKVMSSLMSPINFYGGGVGTFNTKNGESSKPFELFRSNYQATSNGKMGKASGIGDLELMCNMAPIEIGNYVWIDTDADGVQDPSEAGVQGVDVRLYSANFTLVGKTTTNVRGEYYFNMANVDTTGVNATTGAANTGYTGMSYNRQYYIVIGKNGQFSSLTSQLMMSGNNYGLTIANTGQGTNADWNDSDADVANGINVAINGFPYIAFTSGSAGSSNHTYDFGFKAIGTVGNYVWNDTNGNGTQDEGASSGINGIKVHLWSVGADGAMGGGDDLILSTTTTANDASGNSGYYNFTIDINGSYYIQFPTANGSYILTTQTATVATDNNSDANTSTGLSPVFTINPAGSGTTKDNPTIDAGYKCPTGNCMPTSNRKVN